jgi:antitoxin component HigA of HigAB toxin-antitoxin module
MTTTLEKIKNQSVPVNWDDLVSAFLRLRPVNSDKAHRKAVAILERLAMLPDMNKAQSDYFEVLADLVAKYESQRWNIDTSDITVVDILHSFMEEHNMNASELGRLIGNDRTLGHKILTGKRALTTEQIRILADTFKVSTDLFIE